MKTFVDKTWNDQVRKGVTNLCPYLHCTLYSKKQELGYADTVSNVSVFSLSKSGRHLHRGAT